MARDAADYHSRERYKVSVQMMEPLEYGTTSKYEEARRKMPIFCRA